MDNNPYGIAALWQQGDPVIKGVAIILLAMSVLSSVSASNLLERSNHCAKPESTRILAESEKLMDGLQKQGIEAQWIIVPFQKPES